MTETIQIELTPALADNTLDFINKLGEAFGISGFGPGAPLWHMKAKIEEGKIVLEQKQAEELAKASVPAFKTVICEVPHTSNNHDCWILDKTTKTIYYAPHGHHYQIIEWMHINAPGVIEQSWAKSDTASPTIRTGDVKSGHPRTANENPVTSKKLKPCLLKAYYESRGQAVPGGPF